MLCAIEHWARRRDAACFGISKLAQTQLTAAVMMRLSEREKHRRLLRQVECDREAQTEGLPVGICLASTINTLSSIKWPPSPGDTLQRCLWQQPNQRGNEWNTCCNRKHGKYIMWCSVSLYTTTVHLTHPSELPQHPA